MKNSLCIIGGAGHVGLPLGVAFANAGIDTILFDINTKAIDIINDGKFHFKEEGGEKALKQAFKKKKLFATTDESVIQNSKYLLLVAGTPIDEYLNPDPNGLIKILENYKKHFRNGQIVILRSTVYPGTTENIQKFFIDNGLNIKVVFCPERIAQGYALTELKEIPQIIASTDKKTVKLVSKLFHKLTPKVIELNDPMEAELAKLFSNAWRYIKFATANQFFMIADKHNLNYSRLHKTMTDGYARNAGLPSAGLTAGPCLLKDTMQLATFNNNNFFLGHSAMLINEGLPNYIIQKLKNSIKDFKSLTIGILGMSFKSESDDSRDSLSYKLRKIIKVEANAVLCHDFFVEDPSFVSLDNLLKKSDIIILATPHKGYKDINPDKFKKKIFVDIWNFWEEKNKNGSINIID